MDRHVTHTSHLPPSRNSATRTNVSRTSTKSQSEETFTYSLCLLGDLQPLSIGANDAQIKEIAVQLDSAVRQISCGLDWLCLLTDAGHLYSFGSNAYGQLAQGHTHAVAHPTLVRFPLDKRITKISCGATHGGILLETGELFMFGCGSYGRLGTGKTDDTQTTPVAVKMQWRALEENAAERTRIEPHTTIPGFARVASHRAPASSGSASSANPLGQEDDNEVVFVDISCGDRHTLVLGAKPSIGGSSSTTKKPTTKHHIIAFGDGMNGRLGLGSERDYATGMLLTQFQTSLPSYTPTFVSIHAGACHNAAISTAGELFTWGHGADGQLGHGMNESEWLPRDVQFFRGHALASATCGAKHTVAVSSSGVVYAWGRGLEGQLGSGSRTTSVAQPHRVTLVIDPRAAQQAQIEAQLSTGAAASSQSLLGVPDTRVLVRSIAAGGYSVWAVDEQNRLFAWGDNVAGQLGVTTEAVEDTHIVSPLQVAYMDLREPTTPAARVRDRVSDGDGAASRLSRVGLMLIGTSDRFSALVFRTKPPVLGHGPMEREPTGKGSSATLVNKVTQQLRQQHSTLVGALDDNVRWHLSLSEPLQTTEMPSRETAFYQYMTQYKVSLRTASSSSPRSNHNEDDEDDQPRPHERGVNLRTRGKQRGSGAAISSAEQARLLALRRNEEEEESEENWEGGLSARHQQLPACETVKGYNAWLERHLSPRSKLPAVSMSPRPRAKSPLSKIPTDNQKHALASTPRRPQSSGPTTANGPGPPRSAVGGNAVASPPRAAISMIHPNGRPRRPTTATPTVSSRSPSSSMVMGYPIVVSQGTPQRPHPPPS